MNLNIVKKLGTSWQKIKGDTGNAKRKRMRGSSEKVDFKTACPGN